MWCSASEELLEAVAVCMLLGRVIALSSLYVPPNDPIALQDLHNLFSSTPPSSRVGLHNLESQATFQKSLSCVMHFFL